MKMKFYVMNKNQIFYLFSIILIWRIKFITCDSRKNSICRYICIFFSCNSHSHSISTRHLQFDKGNLNQWKDMKGRDSIENFISFSFFSFLVTIIRNWRISFYFQNRSKMTKITLKISIMKVTSSWFKVPL